MKFMIKLDWVLVVRLAAGILLLSVGYYYKDWIPAIFGLMWVVAAFLRRGCGYGNCNLEESKTGSKAINTNPDFTEIK